ncbi:MAG: hypothetical protein WC567_03865 [Kiritimatiellia bacterium]|jgi:hypothetical protein
MEKISPSPNVFAVRIAPFTGIEWKHEDEIVGCYRHEFVSLFDLLKWARERYGTRFAKQLEKMKIDNEWKGNL